jgi:hypothetical protein
MIAPKRLAHGILLVLIVIASPLRSEPAATLTILAEGMAAEHVGAIRTEAAVRGLRVELLEASGSDALADALAQRPGTAVVLWLASGTLRVVTGDGRRSYAPIEGSPSPRVVAAIAASLLDDLADRAAPSDAIYAEATVEVAIDAPVAEARPSAQPPGLNGEPAAAPRGSWLFDVGGLAAPGGIYAGHAGVGRRVTATSRAALLGHVASVPGAYATALSAELARRWGQRVRAELGGRALAAVVRDSDLHCVQVVGACEMTVRSSVGIGVGGFVGLGLGTAFGTFYVRAGGDVTRFEGEGATVKPTGTLGLELSL